jgi:hypothetical protein
MSQVLFLAISSISGALSRKEITEEAAEFALIVSNHARHQRLQGDLDYTTSLGDTDEERSKIQRIIDCADRYGRIDWARMDGDRPSRTTWSRLNRFLIRHGLKPVPKVDPNTQGLKETPKRDQYTTGEARRRVLAANPGLTVYS